MSTLLSLINDWCNRGETVDKQNHVALFHDVLHKAPYHLRYNTDKNYPGLVLIHSTENSDRSCQAVLEANGLIVEKPSAENGDQYRIVCCGMNKILEVDSQSAELPSHEGSDDEKSRWNLQEAEDGTVVKLFNYKGDWILSTTRRIDARRSSWSSPKSFYDLFHHILRLSTDDSGVDGYQDANANALFAALDPSKTYSFVLIHPENHVVIEQDAMRLVHVSTRDNRTLEESKDDLGSSLAGSEAPVVLETTSSSLSSEGNGKRGLIFADWSDPRNVRRFLVDSEAYKRAKDLRKNYPDVRMSYFAALQRDDATVQALYSTFPRSHDQIEKAKAGFQSLCAYVYSLYKLIFIRNFDIQPSDTFYYTLGRIHQIYRRDHKRITFETVQEHLKSLSPRTILQHIVEMPPPKSKYHRQESMDRHVAEGAAIPPPSHY